MRNKTTAIIVLLLSLLLTVSEASPVSLRLEQVSLDQGLSQAEVDAILQDNEGFLWLGTQQGLNFYDAYRIRLISGPEQLLAIQSIRSLFQDSSHRIWVGSYPNRNFLIDKHNDLIESVKLKFPEGYQVIDSTLTEFHEDGSSTLWMATAWELFSLAKDSKEPQFEVSLQPTIKEHNIIRALYRYRSYLLIGTSGGLYAYDIDNKQLLKLAWEASLAPLNSDSVPSVTASSTSGQSTVEQSDIKEQLDAPPPELDDRHNIKGLYRNQQGDFLIATVAGLFEVKLQTLEQALSTPDKPFAVTKLVKDLNIWQVIEKHDFYWLATHDGLYQLFKTGELKHHLRYSDTAYQSADNNIISMIEDREGNLWLGSRNDGVFRWRPDDGLFQYYQQNNGKFSLSHNRVWAVKEDEQGNLWVGTRNGLNKIDAESGESQSFLMNPDPKAIESDSTITDIEIQDDRIWLNTFYGVRIFDKQKQSEVFPVVNKQFKDVLDGGVSDLYFIDNNQLLIINYQGLHFYNTATDNYTFDESSASEGKVPKM